MNVRIAKSLVAAALALPLLAGCGGSPDAAPAVTSAPATSAAAPATSSAPSSAQAPTATPSEASPSPTTDPAADKKDAADATGKFVKTLLTIGYPDKDFDTYVKRVKPLMTSSGYKGLTTPAAKKSASTGITKLYGQRARNLPKLDGDPKVSVTSESSATAKVKYRNQAQVKTGGDWKTVNTAKATTANVTLVKEDGKWLVEDAR